ncbi:MAG: TolC family protein [Muribaculaceae bacterium]|nr:TolC family protein [Muribaculaceae bacterium]
MTISNISRVAFVGLGLTMLSSCHIYNKFDMPDDNALAQEYVQACEADVDSATFGNLQWQQVFTDPVLADLINQALENNVNLDNARLNVEMAQAQLQGARLSYLPSVALAPNGAGTSYAQSALTWTYQLPVAVSWEIDIFGKLLNGNRSAKAAVHQSQAYEQAVRSQVIAGVANCYYAIASLEKQLAVSRQTAENWRQSVEVMKNLKLAGRTNEAGVVQSNANYYSILASITDLEVALHEANNTMSLLLNVMPQQWNISADATLQAPAMMREAIPMRELAARPDIRAAEQSVAVAYYATNQARSAFYPSINISANGGFTNLLGSVISNPGELFLQLAGQLTAPIFARGSNLARLKAARAQQEQAMNNFETALLSASAEVSNAMTIYNKCNEKLQLLDVQVQNLEKSVEYTQDLLSYGTASYLEVLNAQTSLLAAQMSQISCDLSKAQSVINLYQSLGGGR